MSLKDHMKNLQRILDKSCDDVSSIKDINEKYDYEDEIPQGKNDEKYVACGQDDEGYNELEEIFKEKLKPYIEEGRFAKEEAIKALCKSCRDLESPRKREKFYETLEDYLSVNIK